MERKPSWLRKRVNLSSCQQMQRLLRNLRLSTVCEQARCPNIGDCFGRGTATFLILGDACTRRCSFCSVGKGKPKPVDAGEPERVAQAVRRLGLRYVVVTSVTRDDLPDGGSEQFVRTVGAIRDANPQAVVELLIPDFLLNPAALSAVAFSGAAVIGHNVETVPSLYPAVRPQADYRRSLEVLRRLKERSARVLTKSGIMLGLGEQRDEVLRVFEDLRAAGCDFLSIGQYLAPGVCHHPVREFVPPEVFAELGEVAQRCGFAHVESGPYVRSSYFAEEYLRSQPERPPV